MGIWWHAVAGRQNSLAFFGGLVKRTGCTMPACNLNPWSSYLSWFLLSLPAKRGFTIHLWWWKMTRSYLWAANLKAQPLLAKFWKVSLWHHRHLTLCWTNIWLCDSQNILLSLTISWIISLKAGLTFSLGNTWNSISSTKWWTVNMRRCQPQWIHHNWGL